MNKIIAVILQDISSGETFEVARLPLVAVVKYKRRFPWVGKNSKQLV